MLRPEKLPQNTPKNASKKQYPNTDNYMKKIQRKLIKKSLKIKKHPH